MIKILGVVVVCVLVGLALTVAICFGSRHIKEEKNRVLLPECETQTALSQEIKTKSLIRQYQEECKEKADKLVASDIEQFLLPQLKGLLEKMIDYAHLEIEGGELCLSAFEFDYEYRYKIPTSLSKTYYLHELERQLNETGFVAECLKYEIFKTEREYIAIYLDE